MVDGNVRGDDLYVFQDVIAPGHPRSVYDRFVMLLHAVEAAALSDAAKITTVLIPPDITATGRSLRG